MNIREWTSNSGSLRKYIRKEDLALDTRVNVLGTTWDIKHDSLTLPGSQSCPGGNPVTKRIVLKTIATIFDPLNYLSPALLEAKLFLQQLWEDKMSWDDVLSEDKQRHWDSISRKISQIQLIQIPRFIGTEQGKVGSYYLLCFCDASIKAYSAVIYLRAASELSCKTSLIFAKMRLNPPKRNLSLPRLELMAVLIGVRILVFTQNKINLPISKTVLWTDSQCTLHWIKSTKPLSVFIKNRVDEIRHHKNITFRYISSTNNPADIATRGMPASKLQYFDLWWSGPNWVNTTEFTWPTWNVEEINKDTLDKIEAEELKQRVMYETSNLTYESTKQLVSPFPIDEKHFSSLNRLLRVSAWVMRFVNKLLRRNIERGPITAAEIEQMKLKWELFIQRKEYSDIIEAIKTNKPNNLKTQLGLKLDNEGRIRCHGRLRELFENDEPKLLPKSSHYTSLVINKCHQQLFHSGVTHTLAQVRREYWIPHGRSVVRQILNKCLTCRRWEGGPYRTPPFAVLPPCRVFKSSPFSFTGLDYLGPLYIKVPSQGISKVWVCLFTCICVRAIHLEMVRNLTAEQFLLCLRRFVARKGRPELIICDNASQFKVVKSTIEKAWGNTLHSTEVNEYSADLNIKWKFITEYAPWKGGFYERLIALIKRSLRKGIGRITLSYDHLSTILSEVEATVNTRPLVYIGSDINDGHCLTPADFLSPNSRKGCLEVDCEDEYVPKADSTHNLLEIWKRGQRHLQTFWKSWYEEYLLSLRERYQTRMKCPRVQSNSLPHVGEIVLIGEKNQPRGKWKTAMIKALIKSDDNQVRTVKLRLPSQKIICRPLNLVYPLECTQLSETVDKVEEAEQQETTDVPRTRRKAAEQAKERISKLYRDPKQ